MKNKHILAEILQTLWRWRKRGRERAENRERTQDTGKSQPSLEGHTHEWLVVGGTREDEIMNGCPRTST